MGTGSEQKAARGVIDDKVLASILEGVSSDLNLLLNLSLNPNLRNIAQQCVNFPTDILRLSNQLVPKIPKTSIIRVSDIMEIDPFACDVATFAGLCSQFQNAKLRFSGLESAENIFYSTREDQAKLIEAGRNDRAEIMNVSGIRMLGNTINTYTLMRMLGQPVLRAPVKQLSLGAGRGIGETALNIIPKPSIYEQEVVFEDEPEHEVNITVVDNDNNFRDYYNFLEINKTKFSKYISFRGLIANVTEPSQLLVLNGMNATRVTCLKMSPEMIPNVANFFSGLIPIIADESEFLVSIGGGNSPAEWEQRKLKMYEILNYLESHGFNPILVKFTVGDETDRLPRHFQGLPNEYAHLWMLRCNVLRDKVH